MPKKIDMPFLRESKEAMVSGKKRASTRTRRYGYPGDWFKQFGRTFILTSVQRTFLDIVVRDRYLEEGFASPSEFIECWDRLHPRVPYAERPTRVVFYHRFTLTRSRYHQDNLKMGSHGKFNRTDLTSTQKQGRSRRKKQRGKLRGMPNSKGTSPRQFTAEGEPVFKPAAPGPITMEQLRLPGLLKGKVK
jgi:hypothetical protein